MSAAASGIETKPLSFMEKLHPLVSFYQPPEVSTESTSVDYQPRLIIIATWTDARDAHIAKYISKYQALYPRSRILLLKSTIDCIFLPDRIAPAMKIAASVVRDAFQTPWTNPSPPLLVHTFSQGGSSSMSNLYDQYAIATENQEKLLPPHVTIFDSAPGRFSIPKAVAFVEVGLPLPRVISLPILYGVATFWTAFMALGILPDSLSEWYRSHNDDLRNITEVRRVYIYSTVDRITDYRDVEAHAAEAKTEGYTVALEKFDRSAHVSHLRKDEKRYWDIVTKTLAGEDRSRL